MQLLKEIFSLGNIVSFSSVFGFLLTIVNLIRIHSVSVAQKKERHFLRNLYGISEHAETLNSISSYLRSQDDDFAKELSYSLIRFIGHVRGIDKTLKLEDTEENTTNLKLFRNGYFTVSFLSTKIKYGCECVDIICYRNINITNLDFLEDLQEKVKTGVKVRVMSVSSEAPNEILSEVLKFLPKPIEKGVESFKEALSKNENFLKNVICSHWTKNEKNNLKYKTYVTIPNAHFIRVDNYIYYGFLQTSLYSHPKLLNERPYLVIPTREKLGIQLNKHFEDLWNDSTSINII